VAVRDTVRDPQRRLAALDGTYARAVTNFERICARRAEVLAEHDNLVATAEREVERTVAVSPGEIGADLTATLLGLWAGHVHHVMKQERGRQHERLALTQPCGRTLAPVGLADRLELPLSDLDSR
jgi:hypothetical protein